MFTYSYLYLSDRRRTNSPVWRITKRFSHIVREGTYFFWFNQVSPNLRLSYTLCRPSESVCTKNEGWSKKKNELTKHRKDNKSGKRVYIDRYRKILFSTDTSFPVTAITTIERRRRWSGHKPHLRTSGLPCTPPPPPTLWSLPPRLFGRFNYYRRPRSADQIRMVKLQVTHYFSVHVYPYNNVHVYIIIYKRKCTGTVYDGGGRKKHDGGEGYWTEGIPDDAVTQQMVSPSQRLRCWRNDISSGVVASIPPMLPVVLLVRVRDPEDIEIIIILLL